jgi:H+/Cl- antiporter ClcA
VTSSTRQPPGDILHAAITAVFIGALSGAITSVAAWTIYRAKNWRATATVRLAAGALAAGLATLIVAAIAEPQAATGPGGGAILWAENSNALPMTLLIVALLRAAATTGVVAAGGCGGVFVPFLAVGDLSGRVFAPGLGLGNDLAGAAGAAAGISGGYHLPLTAAVMVLWLGGPPGAMVTCFATVMTAFLAGTATTFILDRLEGSQIEASSRL